MNYRSSLVQTKREYFLFFVFYLLFCSGASFPNLDAGFQLETGVSVFLIPVPTPIFVEVNVFIELWWFITQVHSKCAI